MMRKVWKAILGGLFGLAIMGALVWFGWPKPIAADLATVAATDMVVTVDEDAKTRVRHVYTVSAPVAGKVLRTTRHVGDQVTADETVVAAMEPMRPGFHDLRTHEELRATLTAAEAAVQLAEAEIRRMEAGLEFSRSELVRAQQLIKSDAISVKALDRAKFDVQTNEAALASAKAQLEVRRSERAMAAARLMDPIAIQDTQPAMCCIQIRAPVSGRVLRIPQESEAVVQPGTPLIDIGDPQDLEIVADLLSQDAVRVQPGADVAIENWGGPPLRGQVVRVEPGGFLKVSALGIEEQRVRVIVDFTDPPTSWAALGHDFRVVVRINIWSGKSVTAVPVSALFRAGDAWAVFVAREGRAATQTVQIGHRNNRVAEVVAGLSPGDRVIVHPNDRIADGVRVAAREIR
jgi:HlyD family secretion protein